MTGRRAKAETDAGYARLTDRDLAIIDALGRHKVLGTAMLTAVFFPSQQSARLRLGQLVDLGFLARFRNHSTGAWRYTLAWEGHVSYATRHGEAIPTRQRAEIAARQAIISPQRRHRDGVNGFFAQLHLACRATGEAQVTEWINESAAAHSFTNLRPDAAGTITWHAEPSLAFWYEHDMGSENLHRLIAKLDRYRRGRDPLAYRPRALLIGLPGPGRLDGFLAGAGAIEDITVAATVSVPFPGTIDQAAAQRAADWLTEPRWHRLGDQAPCALADLAD